MFGKLLSCLSFVLVLTTGINSITSAQVNQTEFYELKRKVESLESENLSLKNRLDSETDDLYKKTEGYAPLGLVFFLFGCFCALWAQNTGRNAWAWFFLGFLFSAITAVGLLIRNADDIKRNK